MYQRTFEIHWADLDPNRHMRHSAYPDYATHVRFSFLAENGFPQSRFEALDFGPVILRETTTFKKEVGPGDTLSIDFQMKGLSPDASRFCIFHEVRLADGNLAATIEVKGSWMDLTTRKLRPPHPQLASLLRQLPRTEDFEELDPLA